MSVIVHSVHNNIVTHIATPCGLFGCEFRASLTLPFPARPSRTALCCRVCCVPAPASALHHASEGLRSALALLSCVSWAGTGLSKRGVGVEPLICLDLWDRSHACARGGGRGGGKLRGS